jgi:hypothetical protein
MGHRAVNPQPLVLESVIERAHIIQVLYFERDLLDVVRFLRGVFGPRQSQFMVLGLGVSAEKANTPLEVFIGDREAHDAAIKIPHFHQVVTKESHMAQPGNLRHRVLLWKIKIHDEECFLTLPRNVHVSTLEPA